MTVSLNLAFVCVSPAVGVATSRVLTRLFTLPLTGRLPARALLENSAAGSLPVTTPTDSVFKLEFEND